MAIDLITGHQGVSHISADQIATINNAMMDNFGANKVMRLVGGELTADGLTITISEGYWRVNGFDMEIQEGETLYIDPTTIGLSRIDDIYVEILQDIPTGAQRAEIYIALGEPSATPTAPDEPTAPYLNTDILLQIIKLARVTVSEGAMIMEDYSVAYNIVTPEDLAEVQTAVDTAETHATTALNIIRSFSNDDVYSTSKAYNVGDHVIYNNALYKCITACSAASWSTNKNCFTKTTLTAAVTELNSSLMNFTLNNEVQCETWLGKKLYRKTVKVAGLHKTGSGSDLGMTVGVSQYFGIDVTNVSYAMIDVQHSYAAMKSSSSGAEQFIMPFGYYDGNNVTIRVQKAANVLNFYSSYLNSWYFDLYITLLYTKD
jgi:hypothetical protein